MFHVKHRKLPEASLDKYMQLIRKYHATLDLVSDRALARLPALVDEAQTYVEPIASFRSARPILDVGSGVGLPAIVIAMALPHRPVLLVERRRRRATFLKICVAHLGLSNAVVIEDDVRHLTAERVRAVVGTMRASAEGGFGDAHASALNAAAGPAAGAHPEASAKAPPDEGLVGTVTAQAVATFRDVYCLTRHLHADGVLMVSRKGPDWREEVAYIPAESGRASTVHGVSELASGGTLVAIEVPGGLPCPPLA